MWALFGCLWHKRAQFSSKDVRFAQIGWNSRTWQFIDVCLVFRLLQKGYFLMFLLKSWEELCISVKAVLLLNCLNAWFDKEDLKDELIPALWMRTFGLIVLGR